MQRRTFLASLIATAVLDPERLLWVPGQKTISIPAPREWIWINLRETRDGGLFSNGGRYPNDYLSYVPVDELDPVCAKAFDNFKDFCVLNFGKLPETGQMPVPLREWIGNVWSGFLKANIPPGSGIWIDPQTHYPQKPAW